MIRMRIQLCGSYDYRNPIQVQSPDPDPILSPNRVKTLIVEEGYNNRCPKINVPRAVPMLRMLRFALLDGNILLSSYHQQALSVIAVKGVQNAKDRGARSGERARAVSLASFMRGYAKLPNTSASLEWCRHPVQFARAVLSSWSSGTIAWAGEFRVCCVQRGTVSETVETGALRCREIDWKAREERARRSLITR